LSVAWDVSTANYIRSFSVSGQETVPTGLFFSPDGLNMYVIGQASDSVHQYLLSVAWDVSTAIYTRSFSVSGQDGNSHGLFISSDGLNMYMMGGTTDSAYQYLLSVAWDVSTASYIRSFQEPSRDTLPTDIFFSSDGLKMYFVGNDRDSLEEYSLSSAWNISTSILTGVFRTAATILPPTETTPNGLFFSSNGLNMYVIGSNSDNIHQYLLSSAWSIKTYDYHFNVVSRETFPSDVSFSSDGLNMYVIGQSADAVQQYSLGVAWEISTAVYTRSFSVLGQDNNSQGLFFSPDGLNMYMIGSASDSAHQYLLSVAWDVSTASYIRSFSVSGQETAPSGLFFSPDGLNMYVIGTINDSLYQYSLNVAWDIGSATYTATSNRISRSEGTPLGLYFKPDGLVLYTTGPSQRMVFQYQLTNN
jgi:sugar lactone lactonase YvrE